VLGQGRLLCATCLKISLMIILLRQLACRNHHEVHCCDCIKTGKQKFEIQLKKVKTSKINGRKKIVHLLLALAGVMYALMDNNYKGVSTSGYIYIPYSRLFSREGGSYGICYSSCYCSLIWQSSLLSSAFQIHFLLPSALQASTLLFSVSWMIFNSYSILVSFFSCHQFLLCVHR